MSALTEFLFPAPAPREPMAILRWWERRRVPYNVAVGAAGMFSLTVVSVVQALPPFSSPVVPPLGGILVFGILANVCYCLGPLTELAAGAIWGRTVLPTGPTLYRMGLTFSVGLALLPTLIVMIMWVVASVATVLTA
ncbi:MAG TPA: hypothetical protein VK858_15425 [Longimicrobiales bacterium]|nr:hypothetical protein [Longimicrobiales bacterium]